MKLERQSILGSTVTGYKVVETATALSTAEPTSLPDVEASTPQEDIATVLLQRLQNESASVGGRNGKANR